MSTRKILLVDDHALVHSGIRAILDARYLICGEAENGQQAIEMAELLKPDLILMDVSMPVIGGIEATRQIRRLLPNTRIFILSMHEGVHIAASARSAGADGSISETAKVVDLLAAIDELLSAEPKGVTLRAAD